MRCIYCDGLINKVNISDLLIKEDILCINCRKQLNYQRRYIKIGDIKIETFYEYDSLFRSILLQYKECYDEALKDVFLHRLNEYIFFRYYGYEIIPIPSSRKKIQERGFDHLRLIYENVGLKINDGLIMKEDLIQQGKGMMERKRMIDNYIYTGKPMKKALIVDDVITTGSSVVGAYNAIKPHARHIKIIVLASKL